MSEVMTAADQHWNVHVHTLCLIVRIPSYAPVQVRAVSAVHAC
jgi:hypothetical protein